MKYLVQKEKSNRIKYKSFEIKKFILKSLFYNTNFSKLLRWKVLKKTNEFSPKTSLNHLTNRCVVTGRKKRLNALYHFSRIFFLKLARSGYINGLKKSSW